MVKVGYTARLGCFLSTQPILSKLLNFKVPKNNIMLFIELLLSPNTISNAIHYEPKYIQVVVLQ